MTFTNSSLRGAKANQAYRFVNHQKSIDFPVSIIVSNTMFLFDGDCGSTKNG